MKRRSKTRARAQAPAVAAPPATGMRISDSAFIGAGPAEAAHDSPFVMPRLAPGVVPRSKMGANGLAMDSAASPLFDWAGVSMHEGLQFMGYPYLAELTQRAEYRRPSEILAKEMTRKWIKLRATGDEESDAKAEKIKRIEAEMKRLNVRGVIRRAAELDGFFGRGQIFIDTGVGLDDSDEVNKSIARTDGIPDAAKIAHGSLRRLKVVEPMWTYPSAYNSTDPLADNFYRPTSWYVMGTEVHASRLLTVIGRPVPDMLKPAYAFGGLSLSQMAKPYVDNWLRTRQSVSDLLHAFSVMVLKTDMSSVLLGGGGDTLRKRVELFNRHRDNRGLFVVNKDTEDFANIAAPLSGLDVLQSQSQEQMSAVTGIPLSILLGITPHGLNASNEGEIRAFYAWIEAEQEAKLSPTVMYILQVIQLSQFGEIDPDIGFEWEPLWAMSEKERAEIDKMEAETDAIYVNDIGSVSAHESRVRLASKENSPYQSLDVTEDPVPPTDPDDDEDLLSGETDDNRSPQPA